MIADSSSPPVPTRNALWPGLVLLGIALYRVCFWVPGDDHWWHMLTGRLVLETGRVPSTDPFSFTFQGAPWINWEWLAGVVMYLAWAAGGALGLTILRAVSLGGTILLVLRHWRRQGGAFLDRSRDLAALLVGAALLLVAMVRTNDRPHTYAYLLLAAAHALATRIRDRWSMGAAAGLVALFVVWVNFHPSWMLGMGLCGAVFLDALIRDWRRNRRLLPLGAAMAASVLLTPNLGRFFGSVSDIFSEKVSAEWDPVWRFLSPTHVPLITFLLVALAWIVSVARTLPDRSFPAKEVCQQLVLAVLLVLAFRHAMLTPVFTIAALPYLRLDRLGWGTATRGLKPRIEALVAGLATVLILVLVQKSFGRLTFGIGVDPHTNPVAQASFLEARGLGGKIYCTSKEAHGYMAFRLWPKATIYIDGRVPQVFPASFLERYRQTGRRQVLNEEIDRYGIDHVVLAVGLFAPVNVQTADALRARGDFALVYFDENGALWSRRKNGGWPCPTCRPFEILDPYLLLRRSTSGALPDSPALRQELAHLQKIAPGSKLARDLARAVRRP
ncbi:MAG TPA: hypothetical protein VF756_02970 [Thermoanaerobaculia bacterium]